MWINCGDKYLNPSAGYNYLTGIAHKSDAEMIQRWLRIRNNVEFLAAWNGIIIRDSMGNKMSQLTLTPKNGSTKRMRVASSKSKGGGTLAYQFIACDF